MFCPHCGSANADNAWSCQACGAPLVNPYEATVTAPDVVLPAGPIYNWLAPAVAATVLGAFCSCLSIIAIPCGIVSIVYAAQVNGLVRSGDIAAAVRTARLARTWCLVTFGVAAAGVLFILVFLLSPVVLDILGS